MVEQTISVHNGNSSTVGQAHNNREAEYLRNHVNQDHVHVNGYHRTIIHENVEDAINRIFADSLEEYNAKKRADKKHPGREIKNYYKHLEKLCEDKKKKEGVKGKRKAGYNALEPCYEVIIQFGNVDTVRRRGEKDIFKLSSEIAELMLEETIRRMEKLCYVSAKDKNGNQLYDENGNERMWKCMEFIGVYIHDDEANKGIHAHIDYVPIAHNYSKGLSMQPGLTKALSEMGLGDDIPSELYEKRTRLMKNMYGIDYHDTDYLDEHGKPLPKKMLTQKQLANRELASKLVPFRTGQEKLQEQFRKVMREVAKDFSVPLDLKKREKRGHLEHNEINTLGVVKAESKKAIERKQEIETELVSLEDQLEEKQQEIALYDTALKVGTDYDKVEMKTTKNTRITMDQIVNTLNTPMKALPEPKRFETAAQYRERVSVAEHNQIKQLRLMCKCLVDVVRVMFSKVSLIQKLENDLKKVKIAYGENVIEEIDKVGAQNMRMERCKEEARRKSISQRKSVTLNKRKEYEL